MEKHPISDMGKFLVKPELVPSLDEDFRPASLANREYERAARVSGGIPVAIALEREDGLVSRLDTMILPGEKANFPYIERLAKAALWAWGGHRIIFGGPKDLGEYLQESYSTDGDRAFDAKLMGADVYERPFTVKVTNFENVPHAADKSIPLGRNLNGNRVGFDLGATDRKSAAVIDGEVVFSEEVEWDPKNQRDPKYHRQGIMDSIRRAAEKLPHVDAIGGSAAGIYINNKVRVASLFRGVQDAGRLDEIRNLFIDIGEEYGVPLVVVNDGTVTALAGYMAIPNASGVFGLAMGSSVAGGVTTPEGNITSHLDEFAFMPIDYRENAPQDEWSEDRGCAVQYLSQQAVERLIPKAGIREDEISPTLKADKKLEQVQKLMEKGDERAGEIYDTIGHYYGYALPHIFSFYGNVSHVLVLGRVMSGGGGDIILDQAKKVLATEFPEIYRSIEFHIPTEQEKRHGQAIAAASLPYLS